MTYLSKIASNGRDELAGWPNGAKTVRCDSDVLFRHFGISLAGIHDIQLMELATRYLSKKFVYGLSKCIERDLSLTAGEKQAWEGVKEKGRKLFAPERGGRRPVHAKVMAALRFQNDSGIGRESAKGYEGTSGLVTDNNVRRRRETYG
ncbi:uncharacterized protein PAC_17129 [Phialocephala subalpina]|uniref:Uncharacterized protein n=1 Tax=Phialocephala subalpina TaxID=576137 RepID=A0A1L7XQC0_9HELO|nr:uncharacterized protein PAC_17129 [Phialocephala subalpina]